MAPRKVATSRAFEKNMGRIDKEKKVEKERVTLIERDRG
jgi:hypothetical protein